MKRSEAEQETVFADLKTGDQFRIVPEGAIFKKRDEGSAVLEVPSKWTEKGWRGAVFHFGRVKLVTRA